GTVFHAGNGQVLSVTVAGTDNYNPATSTVLLNVNPAPLTVTAEDVTRAYGQDNPAFATTYHGLVNGDTPDSLGLAPSFSTPAAGPPRPPGPLPSPADAGAPGRLQDDRHPGPPGGPAGCAAPRGRAGRARRGHAVWRGGRHLCQPRPVQHRRFLPGHHHLGR